VWRDAPTETFMMEALLMPVVAIVAPMPVLDLLALGFGVDSGDGPGDGFVRPLPP
jgi:hypothetical protein